MSHDYFVYCRSCRERHEFNDANHQSKLMHALIRHAGAIAALAPLFEEDPTYGSLMLGTTYGTIDASWFAHHQGHDLAVIDEYGQIDGACSKPFTCNRCDSRHYCRLPLGHLGGCSTRER